MNEEKKISKKKVLILAVVIGVLAFLAGSYFSEETTITDSLQQDDCNVLAFSIKGYLSTYLPSQPEGQEVDVSSSEDIVYGILRAQNDPDIKAVMLSIDSPGGDGVAGEEIARALKSLDKPSVAVIRGIGASAAYWAATGADKIYASKISDVGGIGVTASYLNESNKNAKDGYTFVELSSAKYKDTGDPNKPLTQEEKEILLSDVRKAHNVFVKDVATNRGLELKAVESLANGLTYIGEDALKSGLIDEIGDITTATKYVEDQIGEKAEFCWY
ncbi:MAG: signal peptide peptidase SppA [bacterium]|nr:signal peptide peptidase SppA [bacterium]